MSGRVVLVRVACNWNNTKKGSFFCFCCSKLRCLIGCGKRGIGTESQASFFLWRMVISLFNFAAICLTTFLLEFSAENWIQSQFSNRKIGKNNTDSKRFCNFGKTKLRIGSNHCKIDWNGYCFFWNTDNHWEVDYGKKITNRYGRVAPSPGPKKPFPLSSPLSSFSGTPISLFCQQGAIDHIERHWLAATDVITQQEPVQRIEIDSGLKPASSP